MANVTIYADRTSGIYRAYFRLGGEQFNKSLKTADSREADDLKHAMENTLKGVAEGWVKIPHGADVWEFVRTGGRRENKVVLPKPFTVADLCEAYWGYIPAGAMEENSQTTAKIHAAHLQRLLGKHTPAATLKAGDLQEYVNARSKETWCGRLISARTIRKEISTFGTLWREAAKRGLVNGEPPTHDLRYSKGKEKPPFMTWEEVERRVARGGLSETDVDELWDCLFLDTRQVEELLQEVQRRARRPFIYPMFALVAHTGMRRSELLRAEVDDVDLQERIIHVREKKRDRKVKFTYRQIDLSPQLAELLTAWLAAHPGGQYLLCDVDGSPLTVDQSNHHFAQTLAGTKWVKVRGFHVFRHSFCSNLARQAVDQRVIDAYLGHQTEDMRKRYRHLFPRERKKAIEKVFGPAGS